jgi:hypothetical protein
MSMLSSEHNARHLCHVYYGDEGIVVTIGSGMLHYFWLADSGLWYTSTYFCKNLLSHPTTKAEAE